MVICKPDGRIINRQYPCLTQMTQMAESEARTQSFKYWKAGLDSPTLDEPFEDFQLWLELYIKILNNSSFIFFPVF